MRNANPFKHTLHKHTPLWLTKSHKFLLAASPLFPLPARAKREASFVDAVHRPGGLAWGIGLRITNNGLEIKRAGKGTSTGPSQAQNVNGRFDCPGILGPHPDALLHSQYGRIIACCRERTITFANERKWTYQCRAMVERERAGEYCPDAPECAGLGVMSHNWQRDERPLRVHSLLSLAWLWRVFLCVRWCLYK